MSDYKIKGYVVFNTQNKYKPQKEDADIISNKKKKHFWGLYI